MATSARDARRATASSLSYFLAQIASKGLTFVTFVLVARHFGVAELGRYSYVVTSIGFFALFVDLGLNSIALREIANASDERVSEVLVSALTLKALLAAAAALAYVTWAFVVYAGDPRTRGDLIAYTGALFVASQVTSWSEALQLPFQVRLQMWTASIATVLQRMLFLGAVLVAVAGSFGIRTILIADILSSLVVASFLAMRARAMLAGPLRASWKIIRLLVAQTAPLAMSFPLVFLYLRAEVFLVERGGQFAELGRLSAGTRLVDVFGLLPEMLIVSLFPLVVRHSGDPAAVTRYFRRVIQWLFLGLAPVAIGAWFFGPQLLVTALGSEYASSAPVFTLSAIALVFGFPMELATTFLIAVGQQRWRALIYAVLVVLTIAAGPGLVGHFGAVGAAGLRILTRVTGAAITIALVRYHRGGWIVPARAAILAAPAALVVSYTIGARVGLPWMVNAVTGALLYGFVATRLGLVPSVSYVWSSMSEWRTKQSRD